MGGVDTVRGINYQHGHAILVALQVMANPELHALRVEGNEDVVDIEVYALDDTKAPSLRLVRALQVKSRTAPRVWARSELLSVLTRWAKVAPADALFEFVTDGGLGPSGADLDAALAAARQGEKTALANFLGVTEADELCARLATARIRSEPGVGIESLLLTAEREVRATLPGGRRPADLVDASQAGVDRLFKLLALRAGAGDPEGRLVTAEEIADAVGGAVDLAPEDRWDAVKNEYLAKVAAIPATQIETVFWRPSPADGDGDGQLRANDLLNSADSFVIYGRTGIGKSSAALELRTVGAQQGVHVVLLQAEAYVDGRLDVLVADALSRAVGRDLRSVVGRQALSALDVRIVVDGASEVPPPTRLALAGETRAHLAAGYGARLTFVGRDPAACSSLLPIGVTAPRFTLTSLDGARRESLARLVLFPDDPIMSQGAGAGEEEDEVTRTCRTAVAQAERALGDAAGNPMLLDMALRAIAEGVSFKSRASLYQATVERMGHRGRAADIATTCAGLGLVFSELLDDGRRYANPLEWERLLSTAVDRLTTVGVPTHAAALRDDLSRSGLASAVVTTIGSTQVRGPVHDSFADYLAGVAISERLVQFPNPVSVDDEQRLLFAAEMCPIPVDTLLAVARSTPFTLVGLSQHDRTPLGEDAPGDVAELLPLVLPDLKDPHVTCWRLGHRVMAQMGGTQSGWIDADSAPAVAAAGPRVVLDEEDGISVGAVRLWRLVLQARLRPGPWLRPRTARTIDEARTQVENHALATARAFAKLLPRTVAPQQRERVDTTVGPLGVTAVVHPQARGPWGGNHWPLTYSASNATSVMISSTPIDDRSEVGGRGVSAGSETSVDTFVGRSPSEAAIAKLTTAFNELAREKWL